MNFFNRIALPPWKEKSRLWKRVDHQVEDLFRFIRVGAKQPGQISNLSRVKSVEMFKNL